MSAVAVGRAVELRVNTQIRGVVRGSLRDSHDPP